MKINLCFPMAIGVSDCPFINEIQEPYKKIISKFKYEPHGFCHERPHLIKKFKKLNDWINKELQIYIDEHQYKDKYECKESWLIDYPTGSGQPVHKHPGFVFSLLFFLEGYEKDVNLNFINPVEDMMNPLNDNAQTYGKIQTNQLTQLYVSYPPKSGRLIIWRSYLGHGVYDKVEQCKRIIFSYNYGKK